MTNLIKLTDAQGNEFEFTQAEIEKVKAAARESAQDYVDEFGESYQQPSDWDATAWFGFDDEKAGIDSVRSRAAFTLYSKELVAETERLCK